MKKYYYDCPLQAAFMAKYHGMKFDILIYSHENEYIGRYKDCDCNFIYPLFTSNISLKSYITDDSLHLLEAQVGDLVKHSYGTSACGFIIWNSSGNPNDGQTQIIQRGGTAFFWPKEEV